MPLRINWPAVLFAVIGGILILCLYKRFIASRSNGSRAPQTAERAPHTGIEQAEMGALVAHTHDTTHQQYAPSTQRIMRLADPPPSERLPRRPPTRLPPAPTFQEHLQPAWWYSQANIAPLAEQRNARLETIAALRHNPPRPLPPRTVPPPRTNPLPAPQPVMLKVPGIVAVSSLDPTKINIRSDSQNVHDSQLVHQLGEILRNLPDPDTQNGGGAQWLQQLRNDFPETARVLDKMERNIVPVSALEMTEAQVLQRVYYQLKDNPDGRDMLRERLKEIADDDSCVTGRVARVVDALVCANVGKSDTPRLVTREVLRRELVAMAGAMAGQNGGSLARSEFEDAAVKAYVEPGLCTRAQLTAELGKWADTFSE